MNDCQDPLDVVERLLFVSHHERPLTDDEIAELTGAIKDPELIPWHVMNCARDLLARRRDVYVHECRDRDRALVADAAEARRAGKKFGSAMVKRINDARARMKYYEEHATWHRARLETRRSWGRYE